MFNTTPERFIGVMLAFIVGTTIHEFMHAYTATMLGDNTPRRAGRVTLNPVAHFDPIGFFMFLLLALGVGFFAWGRPVMVNPMALRGGRKGMALVAIAGPLSNLVLGAVASLPFKLGVADQFPTTVQEGLGWFAGINFLLFLFNLIPIPPLDGFTVLTGLLSNYWALLLEPLRRYGFALLLAVLFLPSFLPGRIDILGRILGPISDLLGAVFGIRSPV